MPDEHVQPQLSFSYDAKRDRWNGYNLNEHATIIEEHNKVEMAKRKLKAEKLQEELLSGKLPEGSVKVYTCVTMICVSLGKCALKYFSQRYWFRCHQHIPGLVIQIMCESYKAWRILGTPCSHFVS